MGIIGLGRDASEISQILKLEILGCGLWNLTILVIIMMKQNANNNNPYLHIYHCCRCCCAEFKRVHFKSHTRVISLDNELRTRKAVTNYKDIVTFSM